MKYLFNPVRKSHYKGENNSHSSRADIRKLSNGVNLLILFLLLVIIGWSANISYGEDNSKVATESREGPVTPTAPTHVGGTVDLRKEIISCINRLMDDNPFVHDEARNELLEIGKPAVEPLLEALSSEKTDLRFMACEILAELRDERAIPALLKLLKDHNELGSSVASVAARALGRLGNPQVIPALRACLPTMDIELRYEIIHALGTLRATDAIPQIIPLITDTARTRFDYSVRAAVITTLGKLKARDAVKELVKLLPDKDVETRTNTPIANYVIKSLEGITGVTQGPILTNDEKSKEELIKKWQDWWEKHKVEYGEAATPPVIPPAISPVSPTPTSSVLPESTPTTPSISAPMTITPTPTAPPNPVNKPK